jgi:hypothetical protein
MLQAGSSRVRVPMRWILSSFQPHYSPGVDSASNRNEYQEDSWGVKGGRCYRDSFTFLPLCFMFGNSKLTQNTQRYGIYFMCLSVCTLKRCGCTAGEFLYSVHVPSFLLLKRVNCDLLTCVSFLLSSYLL